MTKLAAIPVDFVVNQGLQEHTEAKRRPYAMLIRNWAAHEGVADQGEVCRFRPCRCAGLGGDHLSHGAVQPLPLDRAKTETGNRREVPACCGACLRRGVCGGASSCRDVRAALVPRRRVCMALLEVRHDLLLDALPLPLQPNQLHALPHCRYRVGVEV